MATRECMICGEEDESASLLRLACESHYVCAPSDESDCLVTFFTQAMNDERQYPAQCCRQYVSIHEYEDLLPFELLWTYARKEQEYGVQAKYRIYCAKCSEFIHPDNHKTEANNTRAECHSCSTFTCTTCKSTLLERPKDHFCEDCAYDGSGNVCRSIIIKAIAEHKCSIPETDLQFKEKAEKEGYQECYACGRTVELAEACNHMTCECGNSFCYICSKPWSGLHGCPQYGKAEYDEEGYNQDGFHRDTGLNREGLTRQQERAQDQEDEERDDDDVDEDRERFERVMARLDQDTQDIIRNMPPEEQDNALMLAQLHAQENGEEGFGADFGDDRPGNNGEAGHDSDEEQGDEERDNEGWANEGRGGGDRADENHNAEGPNDEDRNDDANQEMEDDNGEDQIDLAQDVFMTGDEEASGVFTANSAHVIGPQDGDTQAFNDNGVTSGINSFETLHTTPLIGRTSADSNEVLNSHFARLEPREAAGLVVQSGALDNGVESNETASFGPTSAWGDDEVM